jgi:hypothetical protein
MSRGKQPRPPWIDSSRKSLGRIRQNASTIRAEGYKEIRRGIEKVRAAERLDQDAAYIQSVLSQDPDEVSLSDEIVQSTGTRLGITILSLEEETDRLANAASVAAVAAVGAHQAFISAVGSSDAPSASGVFMAAALTLGSTLCTPNGPRHPHSHPRALRRRRKFSLSLGNSYAL